ncbi:tetratricopeptide repeat protein [Rhodocyclus tenuis]|uniref:tetratricopeptide repeat protein n=1 Tax=Rhodocyclus gracilis TaxID=2929842 RepID=UPI0012989B50|nr:tetratricopeptide repeat protein [Rhodocyclus gracilis]MRD72683.1 tetratricopeptide repeat protein [Rhodocyclus gracilis]
MSLINRMLQDIEAREGADGARRGLPEDVRPLPPAPRRQMTSWWPLAAVGVALAAGAFWTLNRSAGDASRVSAGAIAGAVPAPAAAPAAAPTSAPTVASGAAPAANPPAAPGASVAIAAAAAPVSPTNATATLAKNPVAPAVTAPAPITEGAAAPPAATLPRTTVAASPVAPHSASPASASPAVSPKGVAAASSPPPAVPTKAAPAAAQPPAAAVLAQKPAVPLALAQGGVSVSSPEAVAKKAEPLKVSPALPTPALPETRRVVVGADGASPAPAARTSGAAIDKSPVPASPSERAEATYRRALGSLNAGRTGDAAEELRNALAIDATHTASRQLLLRLLLEARRFDEAADLLDEGLQLAPANVQWAMSLARLKVERGDLPAAWRALQRSLPAASGNADFQGFAGHVLLRMGRAHEAVERYAQATRLAPAEGRWWLGLGLALDADGHAAEARDAWQRARASGTLTPDLLTLIEQKLR